MRNKKFIYTFLLYTAYVWFITFSGSVLPTHFLTEGLNFQQMMLGRVFGLVAQLFILTFVTNLWSRRSWRLAAISSLIYLLLVIKIHSALQFYVAWAFAGFATTLFFVSYNIAHFENTPKEKRGFSSAMMFALPPLIKFVAPLAAGLIATWSMNWLWGLAVFFFVLPITLANFPDNFQIKYSVKKAWREIRATRWFIVIEGVWEALSMGIVPIYTLYFIKDPLPYGAYLAYLSLLAILANLIFGRFTDKVQKRAVFLYPVTIILALMTLLFGAATNDLVLWVTATGGIAFMLPLFWNVSTALVVDAHQNLRLAIPGRELALASGRLLGMLLALASFILEPTPHIIFFVLAGVMLLYPALLFWNTKVSKKYKYL